MTKKDIVEKLKGGSVGSKPTATGKTKIEDGQVLVWLKSRAYVSDKERVNAGLYLLDSCPDRLSKLPDSICEVLDTDVNSRKIAQIARWSGVNPDGVDDEELLDKIISPAYVPFL